MQNSGLGAHLGMRAGPRTEAWGRRNGSSHDEQREKGQSELGTLIALNDNDDKNAIITSHGYKALLQPLSLPGQTDKVLSIAPFSPGKLRLAGKVLPKFSLPGRNQKELSLPQSPH